VTCDCGVIAKVGDMVAAHMHGSQPQPPVPFLNGSLVSKVEGLGILRVGDTAT
jgi:hypothetical protein